MKELQPKPADDLKRFQIGKKEAQGTNIGVQLEVKVEKAIMEVILKNVDLFAWSSAYMPGVDPSIICHELALCSDDRPMAQKKRKLEKKEERWLRWKRNGYLRQVSSERSNIPLGWQTW